LHCSWPRGLGGPGNHHGQHHKHHHGKANKPGKHHRKGNHPGASSSPAHRPGHSTMPSPGHSSQPAQHPSSTAPGGGGGAGGGGGGGTHTSHAPQPPTLPTVVVTPHTGLGGVQTVTVEGFHFKPNTLLAVAECRDRGQNTGLPDCNINNVLTYSPGAKVRSDANVGPVQITVRKTFKSVNCATDKCLVAISEPTLRPDPADEGDEYIHFQ
jgi:hypothetical protein